VARAVGFITGPTVNGKMPAGRPKSKIGQCQRRVIGTPAYFEEKGVPPTPAELLAHQTIIYEQRDGGATWAFRQGTLESTVTVSGRLHVSAGEGIREGVLAGLGPAIASEWLFAPELKSGAVIPVANLLPLLDARQSIACVDHYERGP